MKKTIQLFLLLFLSSCTPEKFELGSKKNPIQFFLVPGQDAKVLEVNGRKMEEFLFQDTGLHFEIKVPLNYISVVESFGSKKADIAIINTFGYILAREKYKVTARLRGVHFGRLTYNGQIITRKDRIKKLESIHGKKFAFVDPASASGYLMPMHLLKQKKIQPSETIFAGRHDTVVIMVYQGKVDAGATFYSPVSDGKPQDARKLVKTQYPDVFEKVQILTLTDDIPNDPIIFSHDFPIDMQNKIITSLKKWIQTPSGSQAMMDLYNMNDLSDTNDAEYDQIRKTLLDLGRNAGDFIK